MDRSLIVAVPEDTTPYRSSFSEPVVGISTGVLAGIGNPVEVVTPEPPTNSAPLEPISTPSFVRRRADC
jgi:hypothetical protein